MQQIRKVAASHSTRSKLFRWMLKRHDELAAMFRDERPAWKPLADEFNKLKLAPDGKEITAQVARHTYWRVRRHVAIATRNAPAKPMVVQMPASDPAKIQNEPQGGDLMADVWSQINKRSGR
ncbi:MAG: hypothetical protein JWP29_1983 [Rhodoferax sp.]|nr:hypothetical protein [Rhodoferax sp.]